MQADSTGYPADFVKSAVHRPVHLDAAESTVDPWISKTHIWVGRSTMAGWVRVTRSNS